MPLPQAGSNGLTELPGDARNIGLSEQTGSGRRGSPESRLQNGAVEEPQVVRASTRAAIAPPNPIAPSNIGPLVTSLAPQGEAFFDRNLENSTGSELQGPPEAPSPQQSAVPSTFTEVLGEAVAQNVDSQPHVLSRPRPTYTPDALENNVQGYVLVSAVLGADGTIKEVRVLRGLGYGLDEAAVRAVQLIKFIPATRGGMPVSVTRNIKIGFSLR